MAELENSARKLLRATYAPIAPPPVRPASKRAFAKHALVSNLQVSEAELEWLKKQWAAAKTSTDTRPVLRAVEATVRGTPGDPSRVALFAQVPFKTIEDLAKTLAKYREREVEDFRETVAAIQQAFGKGVMQQAARATSASAPAQRAPKSVGSRLTGPIMYAASGRKGNGDRKHVQGPGQTSGTSFGGGQQEAVMTMATQTEGPVSARSMRAPQDLRRLLSWGVANDVRSPFAHKALQQLDLVSPSMSMATSGQAAFAAFQDGRIHQAKAVAVASKMHEATEPIGLLHLERLNFLPAGIERGELVYSVPLAPGEEVNISHKEWAHTSEEFSRIVTDFMEHYSEEGVAEKSDLSQSSSSQDAHSSGFNTSVTASGGYGPVSITSSTSFSVADSASESEQTARNQSLQLTRKASARTRKEHKMSFKVASAAGTEDQQVRKIKNPFPDKAARVDYYQLVRKWRVDLFRYGLRLTYDFTIPEPGSGLLAKIQEVQAIQKALELGFANPEADPETTPAWAQFPLKPSNIDRDNYDVHAGDYGALVEAPPLAELPMAIDAPKAITYNEDTAAEFRYHKHELEVPEDYVVQDVDAPETPSYDGWYSKSDFTCKLFTNVDEWIGRSGKLAVVVGTRHVRSYYLHIDVSALLRPEAFEAWQLKTWNAIKEAAQHRYDESRQLLKQRLATLMEELGSQDPLSLRKIEREEVMRGVIRWLFGPEFEFAPSGVTADILGSDGSAKGQDAWKKASASQEMAKVLAQGEVIKFLHHAIEWENMLYILYPYFWSHPDRYEMKKWLKHPDPMHQVFLKSGSARVVLTLRPGFEKAFVAFLDNGNFTGQSTDHYLKITEEMEAFAKTNYPGIRPANPVEGARPLLTPLQRKAWGEIQGIMALLESFRKDKGAYPTTDEGLAALAPYGDVPAADPWGQPYSYVSPGEESEYDLRSFGADGSEGGHDGGEDITSWAEACLIGRWYEYTPTSALDIAFGETLPAA